MKYVGTYSDNQDIVTKEKIENGVEYIIGAKPLPGGSSYKIAYGNGKFVALDASYDYARAVYSTDGINWEETTLPIDNVADSISNITYGGGKFAVVCRDSGTVSYVMYSEDGITWSKSAMPEFNGRYSVIAYTDDRFVAIAGDAMSAARIMVATSTDLINWTTYTPSGLNNRSVITSLVYGAGKLVAGCMDVTTYYCAASDFTAWSSILNNARLNLIAFGNNTFVGVGTMDGYVGTAASSFTSWNVNRTPYSFRFYDLVYGDGKFVALTSSTTNGILYSEDGTNWTEYASPRPKSNSSLQTIAYGDGKFVAIDNYGIIAISTDGKNWENPTTRWLQYPDGTDITEDVKTILGVPTSYVSSVNGQTGDVVVEDELPPVTTSDNNKVLQVRNGRWGAYTITGLNKLSLAIRLENVPIVIDDFAIADVIKYNSQYLAISRNSRDIALSTDCINWTIKKNILPALPSGETADWSRIAYFNSLYIVISLNGKYWCYADDPTSAGSWTIKALPTDMNNGNWTVLDICGSALVAGGWGTEYPWFLTGSVHTGWNQATNMPGYVYDSHVEMATLYIATSNGIYTSQDGSTWTSEYAEGHVSSDFAGMPVYAFAKNASDGDLIAFVGVNTSNTVILKMDTSGNWNDVSAYMFEIDNTSSEICAYTRATCFNETWILFNWAQGVIFWSEELVQWYYYSLNTEAVPSIPFIEITNKKLFTGVSAISTQLAYTSGLVGMYDNEGWTDTKDILTIDDGTAYGTDVTNRIKALIM